MSSATKQLEIMVRVANGPASFGQLMAVASSCGSEVLAACSYWDQTGAVVMLVPQDPLRAGRILEQAGFKCKANSIVLVEMPDKPGLAVLLGQKLSAAGIGVLYSYAFRTESNRFYVVFKTTDDDRALYLLELEALIGEIAAAESHRGSVAADIEEMIAEPQVA